VWNQQDSALGFLFNVHTRYTDIAGHCTMDLRFNRVSYTEYFGLYNLTSDVAASVVGNLDVGRNRRRSLLRTHPNK
jgi:hypothetical protein